MYQETARVCHQKWRRGCSSMKIEALKCRYHCAKLHHVTSHKAVIFMVTTVYLYLIFHYGPVICLHLLCNNVLLHCASAGPKRWTWWHLSSWSGCERCPWRCRFPRSSRWVGLSYALWLFGGLLFNFSLTRWLFSQDQVLLHIFWKLAYMLHLLFNSQI